MRLTRTPSQTNTNQPAQHHHRHIKNIFKREKTPESTPSSNSSSTVGLSKLFHHTKENTTTNNSNNESELSDRKPPKRTPSAFTLRRHHTNPPVRTRSNSENIPTHSESSSPIQLQQQYHELQYNKHQHQHQHKHEPQQPHHFQQPKKLTKAETFAHLQQLNTKNAAQQQIRNSRLPSNQANNITTPTSAEKIVYNPYGLNKNPTQEGPKNTSFYLSGVRDGERVVANPVADPNDYLPDDLKQENVNLLEDYEIDVSTRKLGAGGSSDVRIINSVTNKKTMFALKKFTLLSKETDEEFYKRVSKEYVIHRKAAISRHVVDISAIVRIHSQTNLTRGWGIVMEFCGGGDLFSLIVKPGWKRAPLNEKFCLFKQIAYGVKFLHDNDIVHRDIKPENVLLDANGLAKLCDFGVSEYGHETPGDLTSPVRASHSYVGSPPYSPPEVMILKEKSHNEAKNFGYDPFKMDYWGLGMMLFCLVYCGVPFQHASPNDHAFRDYKFSHKRFCSDHQPFRNNTGYNKGPGSEFKLAAKFESTGASRVAWKLCDPSPETRYDFELLFNDPWFQSLEMCIYEHPDQQVSPFVLPGTGENMQGSGPSIQSVIPSYSTTGSAAGSQAPSRRATFNKNPREEQQHTEEGELAANSSLRSMLDPVDVTKKINEIKATHGGTATGTATGTVGTPMSPQTPSYGFTSPQESSFGSTPEINGGVRRVKSMLDVGTSTPRKTPGETNELNTPTIPIISASEIENIVSSPPNGSLPAVSEIHDDFANTVDELTEIPEIPETSENTHEHEEGESQEMEKIKEEPHGSEENDAAAEEQSIFPLPLPRVDTRAQRSRSGSSLRHETPIQYDTSFDGSLQYDTSVQSELQTAIPKDDTSFNDNVSNEDKEETPGSVKSDVHSLEELKPKVLKSLADVMLDKDGTCDLGYKLKKHNHTGVSNAQISGAVRKTR
ncbi:Serine/threonine-protein kinase PTK2 [Spathaspora sp. JA1]|nr:Serine/threonine-protein kinase PTK2 [Spathaspora sp. JA1]